jgi:beta-lactamase class A
MTLEYGNKRPGKNGQRLPRLRLLSILLIAITASLFTFQLTWFSQQEDRLPDNLIIGGIDVGGMTQAEARATWEQIYAQQVILYYGDSPIMLDPSSVGFRVNWQAMLAEAINISEEEGDFWLRFLNYLTQQDSQQSAALPLHADYQQNLLEQFLRDIAVRYDQPTGNAGYDVQTLTTFAGQSGVVLDVYQAMNIIDTALRNPQHRTVILPTGDTTAAKSNLNTLESLIVAYLDAEGFIYDGQTTVASIFILDLQTGEEINLLGDVAFSAASTMKLPILIDYFRILDREPTQDEAWLMANSLLCSRNSSSNLLMEIIGDGNIFTGIGDVTNTIQYVGARNTYLSAPFVEGTAGQELGSIAAPVTNPNPNHDTQADPFNQTTPEDLGTLYSLLYDCANYGSGLMIAYPNGAFTQTECRRMLELMSANDLERLLQGGIPPGQRISHKNGWIGGVVGDAGIVYPDNGNNYVIAVFIWEDVEFQDFEKLWPLVEGISRAAWNYFSPEMHILSPRQLPPSAQECEGNYLPPSADLVNLDDIDAWRNRQ